MKGVSVGFGAVFDHQTCICFPEASANNNHYLNGNLMPDENMDLLTTH